MKNDIRDAIRKAVDERGLIHTVFARKAGLTPVKFSLILQKKRSLYANELLSVCDALQMTPSALRLYGSDGQQAG